MVCSLLRMREILELDLRVLMFGPAPMWHVIWVRSPNCDSSPRRII